MPVWFQFVSDFSLGQHDLRLVRVFFREDSRVFLVERLFLLVLAVLLGDSWLLVLFAIAKTSVVPSSIRRSGASCRADFQPVARRAAR